MSNRPQNSGVYSTIQHSQNPEDVRLEQRALLQAIPDMVFVMSPEGTYLDFKLDKEHQLIEDLIGCNVCDLSFMPLTVAQAILKKLEQTILTGQTQSLEYQLEGKVKHGRQMAYYEARFSSIDASKVLMVVRDVSQQKQLENELREVAKKNQQQAKELELLEQVRTLIDNKTGLGVLINTVTQAAVDVLGYELIALYLLRDEFFEIQHLIGYSQVLLKFPVYEGIAGRVLRNAKAELVKDVEQDPNYFAMEPNTKSEICIPLFVKDQVAGVLIVESLKRVLQESDLHLLIKLSAYVSLAMEQTELYQELKFNETQYRDLYNRSQQQTETLARRNDELVLLERIRDAIANELDIKGLYQAVAENLAQNFGYHSVCIFEVTDVAFRPVCQMGVATKGSDIPLDQGIAGRVLRTGRADLVPDVSQDPSYLSFGNTVLSELSIPLHRRGKVVGVLSIETRREDKVVLNEDDLRLVSTIAEQVDVAIERAYLYQETRASENKFRDLYLISQEQSAQLSRRANELELLSQVREIISSKLAPEQLFKSVIEAVSQVLNYKFVGIAMIQNERLVVQHQVGYDMSIMPSILSLGQGVIGRVAKTGQAELVPYVAHDPDYVGPTTDSISEVCVPFHIRDKIVGVLNVESTEEVLSESQLEILTQVAVSIGIALEQAQLYQELQSSEVRYRELIENAGDIIYRTDIMGKFVYTNSVVTRLLGYSEQDVLGKHYLELIRPDYRTQAKDFYLTQVKDRTPSSYFEFPALNITGEEIWLGQNVQLVWEKQKLVGMQAVARDVTQRKHMEEALIKQAQELSSVNADLQQFAYVAAHDLQEPLRKIQAFGDRLSRKYKDVLDEQGQDYLSRIHASAKRMRTLIDDLLLFSKTTKHEPSLVSLDQIAKEVISDLQSRLEETQGHIEVGVLPTLRAEPIQMRQVLQNLLGNALKFHRPGFPPVVKLMGQRMGSQWQIYVQDNGIGFDEQYKDRIFKVFQRLHSFDKYEGTGMGLAIVRKIVESYNGSIDVFSRPGEGSTFILNFPIESNSKNPLPINRNHEVLV